MSLLPIVRALGGVLYDQGRRAVIPGPGHSRKDRSVSLLLSGDRLVVHSFGRSSWQEVIDELRRRGLLDVAASPRTSKIDDAWTRDPPLCDHIRRTTAQRLWDEARPLTRQLSMAHVRRRRIARGVPVSAALRHHPALPSAIYADKGSRWPALLAAVSDRDGELCAVEATYLDAAGRRAERLAISRKIIGILPPACAVRLDAAGPALLVGEGVFTTLSASGRFGLPGWALLSTSNLRSWRAPRSVRHVLIAADRGVDGERSARHLRRDLIAQGVCADIAWPPRPATDWNEAVAELKEEGRAGEDAPSGGMVQPPG